MVLEDWELKNYDPYVWWTPDASKRRNRRKRGDTLRCRDYKKKKPVFLEKQNYLCHYCKCNINIGSATFDHIIPISKGGKSTNDNLVLACKVCNNKKGDNIW